MIPTAAGKVFDGWYTDAACTAHAVFPATVSSDMTFYGKMCDVGTVRFLVDGEEFAVQNFLLNGTSYTVKAPEDPEKSGQSFEGWFLDDTFKVPLQFPMQTTESFVCYAKFSSGSFTGTSFGGGQIALIAGLIAIAAGAAFFIVKRRKRGEEDAE